MADSICWRPVMTFELKTLHPDAVPRALAKAERYRLLNEPSQAESICRDVLAADAANQEALTTLVLALTEQFTDDPKAFPEAARTAGQLRNDYDRAYYTGIVWERRAKAHLQHDGPVLGAQVYDWLREAMTWFERAESIRPPANDDALLRWNACARTIMADHRLVPASDERGEPLLLE
jgi:hypothetical protein